MSDQRVSNEKGFIQCNLRVENADLLVLAELSNAVVEENRVRVADWHEEVLRRSASRDGDDTTAEVGGSIGYSMARAVGGCRNGGMGL